MEVDVGTLVSTLSITGGMLALYVALRRELKSDIAEVKAHLVRLDDRVYALATGMKPVIDEASARTPKE